MANPIIPPDAEQPNVLHALTRKRAQIAGEIEHTQQRLRKLIIDRDNVDATIRIFNPAIDVGAIRPKPVPPRHAAFRGEVTRFIFKAFREAEGLVTSHDLTLSFMKERGLNLDDPELMVIMVKRVRACLRAQKQRGLVRSSSMVGSLQGWELVPREG